MNTKIRDLKIKIFADGADLKQISKLNKEDYIKGFTTNPTLMRKAEIVDYKKFAIELLNQVKDKPISFEVFSDDINIMEEQAMEISSWGKNANVKIPITNTKGESTVDLIGRLSKQGVVCNVTAIFTIRQLKNVLSVLDNEASTILSVFAGRIADAGMDPLPVMKESVICQKTKPKTSILWAATREIINIFQAESLGCQIITVPYDLIKKFQNIGKSPETLSLETVSKFYNDAKASKFNIK
jgi:transaldolase